MDLIELVYFELSEILIKQLIETLIGNVYYLFAHLLCFKFHPS